MSNSKEQFQANLGNPYTNPMSDELKLLFEYMEKESEYLTQLDKEDGIDVDSPDYKPESTVFTKIMSFEKYRRAYTMSMYQDFLIRDGVARDAALSAELDKNQREAHNAALTHLLGFKNLSNLLHLEPLYKGEEVSKESIKGLGSDYSDARKEMTDFFLKLISEFSDYNVRELENEHVRNYAQEFQRTIRKNDHDFRVKDGGLKEYHGDIEFE